ncbi:uncharacterized protein [Procambarus clarkii]|uniref:uncharacterized protein isoform X2 n=1 Tax=Procambarus clarkii TaxID=6728 RepID=UPI0037440BFF
MCDKPENCAICKNKFDEPLRRPRNLPCGHTICSQCARAILLKGLFFCPSCHPERSVAADAQLPVNSAEAIITKQTDIRPTSVAPESVEPQDNSIKVGESLRLQVEQQKLRLNELTERCDKLVTSLGEYRSLLRHWGIKHYRLEEGLSSLLEQNNAAMRLLEQEIKRGTNLARVGQETRRQLQELMVRLDTLNAAQEVYVIIKDIDKCNVRLEQWAAKGKELFRNGRTVLMSLKRLENAKASLKATSDKQAAVAPVNQEETTVAPVNQEETTVAPVNQEDTPVAPVNQEETTVSPVNQEDTPVAPVNQEETTVSPVNQEETTVSPVNQEDSASSSVSKVQPIADDIFGALLTFSDRDIAQLLDHSSTMACQFTGRDRAAMEEVEICTSPDTALGKRFISLHTGEVHQAGGTEEHGEYVVVGEYDRLPNDDTHDPRPAVEGQHGKPPMDWVVYAWVRPDTGNWLQFGISLNNCPMPDTSSANVIDGAVGGPDVLKTAARATDLPEVLVLDRGIVLPF